MGRRLNLQERDTRVRTAIIAGGSLLVGTLLGVIVGVVLGTSVVPEEASSRRTVTQTRYITVTKPERTSAQSSPSSSASALAASLPQEAATKECSVGALCDLKTGEVTITSVERTQAINTMGSTYAGDFIVVWFDYAYKGNSTAETGECPWSLVDAEGQSYSINFEATSSYGIEQNAPVAIYEQVQPGITKPGLVVFEVAPNSEPTTLVISDLVNIQGGEIANVAL
jgi:hypothetical protein